MELGVSIFAWVFTAAVGVPVVVVVGEMLTAIVLGRPRRADGSTDGAGDAMGDDRARPRLAVVVPAHNEERGITNSLDSFLPQLRDGDRLLVVADNCTDQTAEVARQAGATVVERHDPDHRGKGYALDFGVKALADDPPDVVIILDADCTAEPGALNALCRQVAATGRPAQAIYLLTLGAKSDGRSAVSALAFAVKNLVRSLGLYRLGLPCLLTGTGMAFTYDQLKDAPLASGHIVEDMQLGLDLALAGSPPMLCPEALVLSASPEQQAAVSTQRTRWEHGHLHTMMTQAPRMITAGLTRARLGLIAIGLELAVPPLALLVVVIALAAVIGGGAWALGAGPWPMMISALMLAALLVAVALSHLRFVREMIPLSALAAAPMYVLWKLPLWLKFLVKRQTRWQRTERSGE